MLKKIVLTSLLILLSASALRAQLESPKLTPVASTENQERLIKEGVILHDQGKYDAAIAKYEEVLKENPDNVIALYEMSSSYTEKGEYRKSLETATRGARYKSQLLPAFYMSMGNELDRLGEPKKAIEAYKAGLKLAPDDALLHYNLGLTYLNMGQPEDARKSAKRAASRNPNHASTQRLLAELFYKGNYKTPSLLAMGRYLVLETNKEKASGIYKIFKSVMQAGVSKGEDNKINVMVNLSDKKDEGDFGGIDLFLGLMKAGGYLEKNKEKTESQLAVDQLNSYFTILGQHAKDNQSKFVWKYYVPYFSEMKERNYVEPFYYYISRSGDDPDVKNWLDNNFRRVNEFLNWSKQYQWAKAEN